MSETWPVQAAPTRVEAGDIDPTSGMLATLVYRSRAVHPLSSSELQQLTSAAQSRNRCESITGLVLYDDARFFQWLEGPADSLQRIMESIRNDPRHTDIEVLENHPSHTRCFSEWNMKLATPPTGPVPRPRDALDAPADVIEKLRHDPDAAPAVLIKMMPASFGVAQQHGASADASVRTMLHERTEAILHNVIRATVVPLIVERNSGMAALTPIIVPKVAEFADLLLDADAGRALDWVRHVQEETGAGFSLYAGLFEPAARRLGDLWSEDRCSEFDVTLGLCRLQTAARLCGADIAPHTPWADAPVVLIAPEPGELHGLGAALDSEVMWGAGWAPQSAFPTTDKALQEMLAADWFDVLDLSLSTAFTREDWLPRMTKTIDLARFASRNPALLVIVGGRVFVEQETAGRQVGADVAATTARHVDAVILQAIRSARRAQPDQRMRVASAH